MIANPYVVTKPLVLAGESFQAYCQIPRIIFGRFLFPTQFSHQTSTAYVRFPYGCAETSC